MASAGLASRRHAEQLISQGRVRVNGQVVTELGAKADPHVDRIEVDGRRVVVEPWVYYLLNKPRRTVTTADDPEGRTTVLDLVRGVRERLFTVGRLDYDTVGAILLTNDGELCQALSHPSSEVPRVYRAKLEGTVTAEEVDQLRRGVELEDGLARAEDVAIVAQTRDHTTLQLTLRGGRNRQVHRMAAAIGHSVVRLARISFADLTVDGLGPGDYRTLSAREVARLRRAYLPRHRARLRRLSRPKPA